MKVNILGVKETQHVVNDENIIYEVSVTEKDAGDFNKH